MDWIGFSLTQLAFKHIDFESILLLRLPYWYIKLEYFRTVNSDSKRWVPPMPTAQMSSNK